MASDGYALQTQKEYPYFLARYCKAFRRIIDEKTLKSETDVMRFAKDVERAVNHGGRGAGEFNIYDLRSNLRPAMRAYVRFVVDEFEPVANDVPTDELPRRLKTTVSRVVRDTKRARGVKTLHQQTCQLCGHQLKMYQGRFYSEGHHLKPLGRKHNGPDVEGNILCVCPNCHARLDFGAIKIDAKKLRQASGHKVRQEFIDYHNALCW